VALSLLFLGCERDEVQQPSSQTLSQQETMNLFFKNYKGKKDAFCDEVVNRLLSMNDSTGIIYELTQKYGQPRWESGQTQNTKSGDRLFIPINSIGKDSISAVFAFIDSSNQTYLKIYEAQSTDTLVSDFVLYYQCSLYPGLNYSQRVAKPHKTESKDLILETTCWDVFTSTDGGTTLNFSYSFCSERIIYISCPINELGGGNPIDSGTDITSGGGSSGGIPSTARNVTSSEKKVLDDKKKELDNDWCPNSTVTGDWNSIKFMIDAALKYKGLYYPNSNTIILRPDGTTSDLLHEVFHHYQNQFYTGGTSQYQTNGKVNIEFETWMYMDVYLSTHKQPLGFSKYITNANTQKLYESWINDIAQNGFTDSNLADYEDWVDIFNTYAPAQYRSKKNPDLSQPNAAISALKCLKL